MDIHPSHRVIMAGSLSQSHSASSSSSEMSSSSTSTSSNPQIGPILSVDHGSQLPNSTSMTPNQHQTNEHAEVPPIHLSSSTGSNGHGSRFLIQSHPHPLEASHSNVEPSAEGLLNELAAYVDEPIDAPTQEVYINGHNLAMDPTIDQSASSKETKQRHTTSEVSSSSTPIVTQQPQLLESNAFPLVSAPPLPAEGGDSGYLLGGASGPIKSHPSHSHQRYHPYSNNHSSINVETISSSTTQSSISTATNGSFDSH